jgi:N-carbamoyl-L-amino-acid hydrolase
VRNGGKYDGRLGIFVPLACVRELHRTGGACRSTSRWCLCRRRRPALQGHLPGLGRAHRALQPAWLDQKDADGITMRQAMQHAGLCVDDIPALQAQPGDYLGFVEVHIEQGPVLNELDLPLGVVTSINGSVRYLCEMIGMASHAGTTPMDRRRDAAAAVAELALYVEQRAAQDGDSVGTIGMLQVPNGSINVVPGRCQFSLDLRAPTDAQRDALVPTCWPRTGQIASARQLRYTLRDHARRCRAQRPHGSALGARRGSAGCPLCTACPAAPATTP